MTRGVVLLAVLLASRALAWDSRCYVEGGPPCQPGPQSARNRWIGPSDEHRALWEFGRIFGRLPSTVSDPFDLKVFTGSEPVDVAGQSLPSLKPVNFADTTRLQVRTMTAGEFAQLPDHAYALWDWALGNETCPLDGALPLPVGARDCHDFTTHMGPVNANHFLPQAAYFYDYYHQLALGRAAACATMTAQLGAEASRFPDFPRACFQEALVLEAVGQHFLEDAWATGHMWERWGSPDLADFPSLTQALLVAMTSGLIHGARGVLEDLPSSNPTIAALLGTTEYRWDDPLNAPHLQVQWVGPVDLLPHPGVGDFYLTDLLALQGSSYPEHYKLLFSCEAAGLRAVYQAAGAPEGPLDPLAPGLVAVDPTSDACFGQRATNAAMIQGIGLDFTTPSGIPVRLELDSAVATQLVPFLSEQAGGNPSASVTAQYQVDVARIVSVARLTALADPTGTALAAGVLPPLLGSEANGVYVKTPLATYVDPPLPWPAAATGGGGERAEALARTFHRAHAIDWCNRFREGDPGLLDVAALRARVESLQSAGGGGETLDAACAVCTEFAVRHLRVGTEEEHDAAREPLCHFLAPGSAQYVYQEAGETEGETTPTVETLAARYCGCSCAGAPDLALDFGAEGHPPDPTITGPVLKAGVQYRIVVTGAVSIWGSQWESGVCLGEPLLTADGPTGRDSEYWFAIPRASSLCEEFAEEEFPNHTSRFVISLDDGETFEHVEPVAPAYNPFHTYDYLVTGLGMPSAFQVEESSNRGDDYGTFGITVECASGP